MPQPELLELVAQHVPKLLFHFDWAGVTLKEQCHFVPNRRNNISRSWLWDANNESSSIWSPHPGSPEPGTWLPVLTTQTDPKETSGTDEICAYAELGTTVPTFRLLSFLSDRTSRSHQLNPTHVSLFSDSWAPTSVLTGQSTKSDPRTLS